MQILVSISLEFEKGVIAPQSYKALDTVGRRQFFSCAQTYYQYRRARPVYQQKKYTQALQNGSQSN